VSTAAPADSAHKSDRRALLGSTFTIALITGCSRIFGLVREQVKALLLGTSMAGDAFSTAFIIPNLLRRLVGEGAMTAAFVPVFTDHIKGKKREEVWEFAEAFFVVMTCLLSLIAMLGVLLAPIYIRYGFGYGYAETPGKIQLTIFLTQLMFPYVLFIGLAALAQAILNSFHRFAIPAATPILLNLAIISCALLLSSYFETPATAFAIGVLLGGVAQIAAQLPSLRKLGMRARFRWNWQHPGIRRVLSLMVPGIFGVGIYQINVAISQALASRQGGGAVSSLQYSSRVLELILGIFVVSLATAILPRLAAHATKNDHAAMADTGLFALRMVAFVTIPATVGTILLRSPIVDILFRFKGGSFDAASSTLTQKALAAHMVGLFFIGAVRVIVPLFFALKDTKTPVIAAGIGMFANIAMCIVLPFWLEHAGIALANSVSAIVQLIILVTLVSSKLSSLRLGTLTRPLCRMVMCTAVMGCTCHYTSALLIPTLEAGKLARVGGMAAVVALSILVYGTLSALTGSRELSELRSMVSNRAKRCS